MADLTLAEVKAALADAITSAPLTGFDQEASGSKTFQSDTAYGGGYHRMHLSGNASYVTSDGRALVVGGDIDEFYRPAIDLDVAAQTLFDRLTSKA